MQGLRSDSALFWAPEKARVRWPITRENAGVT